jgi:integrase
MTVLQSPCGAFLAQFWLFGHRIEKKFDTETEALCFFENLRSIFISNLESIDSAVNRYLDNVSSGKSSCSISLDRLVFTRFLFYLSTQGVGSESPLAKVRYAEIEGFQHWLRADLGLKGSSVNRYFATLKNFFNRCEKWEYISKNPTAHVSSLPINTKEKNVWSDEDFVAVYANLNPRDKNLFYFLKLTGARVSSATRLKWRDIDFTSLTVSLMSQKGSRANIKIQKFPLHDKLKDFLNTFETKNLNNYVFLTAQRTQVSNKNFSKRISKVLRKHQVRAITNGKHLSLHGLRATLATEMHAKGMTINEVKNLLGHSSVKVTEGYLKCSGADLLIKLNNIA